MNSAQCATTPATTTAAVTGGFSFTISTPNTARYFILVAGPEDKGASGDFSNADYTLSTFLDLAGQLTPTTNGVIAKGNITDSTTANRDSFSFNLNRCGQRGKVRVSGNRVNLTNVDQSAQVFLQIGDWSCLSDVKDMTVTGSDASGTTLVFPPPAAVVSGPVAKPQIIGR